MLNITLQLPHSEHLNVSCKKDLHIPANDLNAKNMNIMTVLSFSINIKTVLLKYFCVNCVRLFLGSCWS